MQKIKGTFKSKRLRRNINKGEITARAVFCSLYIFCVVYVLFSSLTHRLGRTGQFLFCFVLFSVVPPVTKFLRMRFLSSGASFSGPLGLQDERNISVLWSLSY